MTTPEQIMAVFEHKARLAVVRGMIDCPPEEIVQVLEMLALLPGQRGDRRSSLQLRVPGEKACIPTTKTNKLVP